MMITLILTRLRNFHYPGGSGYFTGIQNKTVLAYYVGRNGDERAADHKAYEVW